MCGSGISPRNENAPEVISIKDLRQFYLNLNVTNCFAKYEQKTKILKKITCLSCPTYFVTLKFSLKALPNEDTLLPTQMFPRLPARATFVVDTNFVSGTQKMFLILFRNILCPQQMFPSLRRP